MIPFSQTNDPSLKPTDLLLKNKQQHSQRSHNGTTGNSDAQFSEFLNMLYDREAHRYRFVLSSLFSYMEKSDSRGQISFRRHRMIFTVWKSLRYPNVLTLFGASSATDKPPWFFVSSYMENNTLVHFLKHLSRREEYEVHTLGPIAENLPCSKSRSSYGTAFLRILKASDAYRILQDIARGMEYLHYKDILHGDLKASRFAPFNHCVLTS